MFVLLVLIPLSLFMALVGMGAFFWALRNGQYDDPQGSAWRVIQSPANPADNARTKRPPAKLR